MRPGVPPVIKPDGPEAGCSVSDRGAQLVDGDAQALAEPRQLADGQIAGIAEAAAGGFPAASDHDADLLGAHVLHHRGAGQKAAELRDAIQSLRRELEALGGAEAPPADGGAQEAPAPGGEEARP